MRYEKIPNSLFIKNRKRFAELLPQDSLAVFTSNAQMPTNGDGTMGFVQGNAIFYLSGIDQAETMLIIFPDCRENKNQEVLFIKETNEHLRVWEGEKLTKAEAEDISGIENIVWTSDFEKVLSDLATQTNSIVLHLDDTTHKLIDFKSSERILIDLLKEKFPLHIFSRSTEILKKLRLIKQPEEISLIRNAIEITRKGFIQATKKINEATYEYQIEAELSFVLTSNGSRFHAFQPIIAGGKNACVLHYITNNEKLNNGDLLLMDFGAEYANYKADITRVLPISCIFTPRQKEVYESVLNVLSSVQTLMVPGNTLETIKKQANELIFNELVSLGLLKIGEEDKVSKYYPHGVSHYLGLEVHDVGDKNIPFEPGMVLTCEPGIYIAEEGIGIRLENDILITETGNENLSITIPIEIYEIEKLLRQL